MGLHHACAIDSNSSLRCDGHNSHGQSEAGRAQREPGWRRRARAATPDIGWRMREENPDRGARWTEGALDLPLRQYDYSIVFYCIICYMYNSIVLL